MLPESWQHMLGWRGEDRFDTYLGVKPTCLGHGVEMGVRGEGILLPL